MKKYISILLAAVLCTSILAGCGGSGKSDQQAAGETPEKAVQSEKTEETVAKEDTAQDSAQAAADTAANSGAYLIYVLDAETRERSGYVRFRARNIYSPHDEGSRRLREKRGGDHARQG